MEIKKVANIREGTPKGKVIVEFDGVKKEVLEELVTECTSGSCSCGSEEFLNNVDGFALSEDGKTIEITGTISEEEVTKTLKEWNKEI